MNYKNIKLKVIGTNSATKPLDGKVFEAPDFSFAAKNRCFVDCFEDDDKYVLEVKLIRFVQDNVIVEGFIADKDSNVGRISLKYLS